eukprot:COSAG01_NODE_34320_length_549_cov_2.222222_1_plen_183_part_11
MEQPQCVDEMSAVETVLSSPNTTAAFDELYVCFVLETLVDSASPCSAELETCARTASCRSIIGSEDNGAQCAADHACAAYLECSSPTVIPRTCADTDADGIEDNYNCDAHENSLGASPADAVCAGDACTDDECCTMQQVEALCPSEHAVCMEQPQCVDEMSAVETVLSSPNTTAAFDELYVCF